MSADPRAHAADPQVVRRRAGLWFAGAVLTAFIAGVGVGVVGPGVYDDLVGDNAPYAEYLDHLGRRFDLEDEQRREVALVLLARDREIREILARGGEANFVDRKVREAETRTDRRILSVLNPGQRTRFLDAWSARDFDRIAAGPASGSSDTRTPR